MLKIKLFSLVAIPFLFLSSYTSYAGDKYTITGAVENVSYNNSPTWPCYIAVDGEDDGKGGRRNYFHAANNTSICGLAERAKILNYRVKIYAEVDTGANIVYQIEFANTQSKYWDRASR
ncbi:hypothetical protein CJJ18_09265 [Candidatus Williamhamiltonella defendens]|uniref:Putative protein p10 n=2 Tax=root TaxID=1 RepID=VP10_BPAPS|nr:hypothetical protein [Candidatus Hamiltonella defensa]NP_050971.1 hypothetical protein APSE-1_10 [Hamiltonella phage APSE-1]Q9T1T8.1 RecName: Full=Putative protein p10 [Hamiltonella phage APSE-1]AAF03953.1 P10 [Hamiltonella phage APSE-1]ASV34115.1 hypothetical protein CJJ18_09265 [Candidatus Hamiltonella defensa]